MSEQPSERHLPDCQEAQTAASVSSSKPRELKAAWSGGEDTGGIDSAIASTARGENHPNKPNRRRST
jgi:hypothetical protein